MLQYMLEWRVWGSAHTRAATTVTVTGFPELCLALCRTI